MRQKRGIAEGARIEEKVVEVERQSTREVPRAQKNSKNDAPR